MPGALIDAHVHFYPCYELAAFLDAANSNFRRIGHPAAAQVLCLSEASADNWFEILVTEDAPLPAGWVRAPMSETMSCTLHHEDGRRLCIIAGHQVVTCEDLEVLTIGVRQKFVDGSAASDVVAQTIAASGLPLLPWGFGKWVGSRGEVITDLLERYPEKLFVGDNGGRLRGTALPPHLAAAPIERRLNGSDTLPMAGEESGVGSYGGYLAGEFDEQTPFASLLRLLAGNAPEPFGELESPFRFVRNQALMQWRKRGPQRRVAA